MSEAIISVENLGKKYRIKHQAERQRYVALRDVIAEKARGLFRKIGERRVKNGEPAHSPLSSLPSSRSTSEDFWALKDVSFEVRQGEVVGIIGRNGAGKSTLLKILSRITEPTEGRVRIKGRVASLLEVGTGFHPELTGRENIFLNGAILGMHRAEIKNKFDEIVAFAEVEKFLDTPVKRYSSGMYVRLAFAVAAHLEPDILIVDEVLAVGDSAFQEKCLGKMEEVSESYGRTVLFVTHNLSTLNKLCQKGILLESGRLKKYGPIEPLVAEYVAGHAANAAADVSDWKDRVTNGEARITFVSLTGAKVRDKVVPMASDITISFRTEVRRPVRNPSFGVLIQNSFGEYLLDIRSSHQGFSAGLVSQPITVNARISHVGLLPGNYSVSVWISDEAERIDMDYVKSCIGFSVVEARSGAVSLRLDSKFAKYWVSSSWDMSQS